jgi:hypothetical protein
MAESAAIAACFARAIDTASKGEQPFRHWLLRDVLPRDECDTVAALPIESAAIADTLGRRETNNATRVYFGRENQARFPVCAGMAAALQGGPAVDAIERATGVDLDGSSLRIEYCQDRDGFWLEPHTDIGAKRLTLLVYLSDDPGSEDWGTDLMDEWWFPAGRAPYARNRGMMFVPGATTYHGFRRRPIHGVRRSIIVNYVGPEWRARYELAFPDRPVRQDRSVAA